MSFSLALSNGDLVQQGDALAIVYGSALLGQNINLWVQERYGIDRFHPGFGSQLQNWIGSTVSASTRVEVISEIERVLLNMQAVQTQALKDQPQKFSLSELLMDIISVTASVSFDTVSSAINVANGQMQSVTTTTSATTMGS